MKLFLSVLFLYLLPAVDIDDNSRYYDICFTFFVLLLLLGAELPLVVESFGLLKDIFPFPLILDAGSPVSNVLSSYPTENESCFLYNHKPVVLTLWSRNFTFKF